MLACSPHGREVTVGVDHLLTTVRKLRTKATCCYSTYSFLFIYLVQDSNPGNGSPTVGRISPSLTGIPFALHVCSEAQPPANF